MVLKQRIAKSEIHFFIEKIQKKGYRKVSDKTDTYSYTVLFKRGKERLHLRFTNNGWLSIY